MAVTRANCPFCGGPITFQIGSSVVVVCPHCRSAVARADRELASLGKVAALVETGSPLAVGIAGSYQGNPFELCGRAQLQHQAGGVWDEWYAAFSDGRWGWLAEAQGRFYLLFETRLPGAAPAFEQLVLGQLAPGMPAGLGVAELGRAVYAAADGEIPFRLTPGEAYTYADLYGPAGDFATLDYSETPPLFYLGREVTLADLGIRVAEGGPLREKRIKASRLECPNCRGSLELRAPDETLRVGCQYCGALLDCGEGKLAILQTLRGPPHKPLIPLGSTATFEGETAVVIAFLIRSCEIEGTRYPWHEYLLYHPKLGFRWLVHSDNHWSYVRPVQPGAVREQGRDVVYQGKRFKRFQDADAVVDAVYGECYWKVEIGETVTASDFVAAPRMLSREVSRVRRGAGGAASQQLGEINWSLGEYLRPEEIEAKLKLKSVPRPRTVGACQPFAHRGMYIPAIIFFAAALVLIVFAHAAASRTRVFEHSFEFAPQSERPKPDLSFDALLKGTPGADPLAAAAQATATPPAQPAEAAPVVFSEPFELAGRKNLYIKGSTPAVDNSWIYLDGDLVNEETGLVQAFEMPIEYYHGRDSEGAWTEGSRQASVHLSALKAGRYTLRLELQRDKKLAAVSVPVSIVVTQGVPRALNDLLLLLAILIPPILVAIMQWAFERRRWSESMYNPYESS